MEFVRYDSITQTLPADFEAQLEKTIAAISELTRASVTKEGANRAVRFAHAKAYGLVRAEVEVLEGIDVRYAQGVFARPGRHPAVIRFSNGLGHLGPDARLGALTGMAIKLFDVPGPSLLDAERDAGTMDYALINAPVFFANTARDYVDIARLFGLLPGALYEPKARRAWLHDFLTSAGTLGPDEWLWDELFAFMAHIKTRPQNLLLSSFFSMGAVRHGEYVAKVRAAPLPQLAARVERRELNLGAEADVFRDGLVSELAQRPYAFDLQVQLCVDPHAMPVENTSIEWPEALSPFRTVARIHIPQQDISGPRNLAAADVVAINPWRVPEAHRPLGEIMTVRKEVYWRSSVLRRELNQQERREPASVDDALSAGAP
jgi:hypothetical protein